MKSQIKNNLIKQSQHFNNSQTTYKQLTKLEIMNTFYCNTVIINNTQSKVSYRDILTSRAHQPLAAKDHSDCKRSTSTCIGRDAVVI